MISRFLISVTVDDLEDNAGGLGHKQDFAVNFIGTSNRTETIRAATQWWKLLNADRDDDYSSAAADAAAADAAAGARAFKKRMGNPGYVVGTPLIGCTPKAAEIDV